MTLGILLIVNGLFFHTFEPVSLSVEKAGSLEIIIESLTPEIFTNQTELRITGKIKNTGRPNLKNLTLNTTISNYSIITAPELESWFNHTSRIKTPVTIDVLPVSELITNETLPFTLVIPKEKLPFAKDFTWGPREIEISGETNQTGLGKSARAVLLWDSGMQISPTKLALVLPVTPLNSELKNSISKGTPLAVSAEKRITRSLSLQNIPGTNFLLDPLFTKLTEPLNSQTSTSEIPTILTSLQNLWKTNPQRVAFLPEGNPNITDLLDNSASALLKLPTETIIASNIKQGVSPVPPSAYTAKIYSSLSEIEKSLPILNPTFKFLPAEQAPLSQPITYTPSSVTNKKLPSSTGQVSSLNTIKKSPFYPNAQKRTSGSESSATQNIDLYLAETALTSLLTEVSKLDETFINRHPEILLTKIQTARALTALITRELPFDSRPIIAMGPENNNFSPIFNKVVKVLLENRWTEPLSLNAFPTAPKNSLERDFLEKPDEPVTAASEILSSIKDFHSKNLPLVEMSYDSPLLENYLSGRTKLFLASGWEKNTLLPLITSASKELRESLSFEKSSPINLISGNAPVPIRIINNLKVPLTLKIIASPSDNRIKIEQPGEIVLPPLKTTSLKLPLLQ